MADTTIITAKAPAPAKLAKKPKAAPSHPKTSEMVNQAIKDLKEGRGSSMKAIKKYITVEYKIEAEKLARFIRKYLKSAVASGALIQTKGRGASGSFKISAASKMQTAASAAMLKKTSALAAMKKKTAASKVASPTKEVKTRDKKAAAAKKKRATAAKSLKRPHN